MSYTIFTILGNGNLHIKLDYGFKGYIREQRKEGRSDDDIFIELIESYLCNGYHLVRPQDVGALTDSILLADNCIDSETTAEDLRDTQVWYNPQYALKSEVQELLDNGYIIFELSDTVESESVEPSKSDLVLEAYPNALDIPLPTVDQKDYQGIPVLNGSKKSEPKFITQWFELIPFENLRKRALLAYKLIENKPFHKKTFTHPPSLSNAISQLLMLSNQKDEKTFWEEIYYIFERMEDSVKLKQ